MEPSPPGAEGGGDGGGGGPRWGLGRCAHFFWLGVAFDAVGAAVLFTGVFADLLFYDMLLYLGAIIIFLSLLWWVSWYTGNIEMLPEELVSKMAIVSPKASVVETVRGRRRHRRSRHRSSSCNSSNSSSSRRLRASRSLSGVSDTFLRFQRFQRSRRRCRRRSEHTSNSLTVLGQLQKVESKDVGGRKSISSDPQDECRQSVDSKPENPWGSSRWVWPVFSSSQSSATQGSKIVPLVACQPVTGSTSRSHSSICLTSQCHPMLPVASQSHPHLSLDSPSQPGMGVNSWQFPLKPANPQDPVLMPVVSSSHPHLSVHSVGQPGTIVAAQSDPLARAASQSHPQLPGASHRPPRHLPQAAQTQPPYGKDSGRQTLVTQDHAEPVVFVHTLQTMGRQGSPVVQDVHDTSSAQASQSHSLAVQEAPKKPSLEPPPTHSQEWSPEQPDTAPPLPGAVLPTIQAQRSDSTGRALRKGRP